jgi:hypothetical protein
MRVSVNDLHSVPHDKFSFELRRFESTLSETVARCQGAFIGMTMQDDLQRGISCAAEMFIGYSLSTHRKKCCDCLRAMEEDGDAPMGIREAQKVRDIFVSIIAAGMDVRRA